MAVDLSQIKVIDTDTHVIEPPDLWTSRVSVKKWGDLVPHVRVGRGQGRGDSSGYVSDDSAVEEEYWCFGEERTYGVAREAMAGWRQYPPDRPLRLSDADPATWDPTRRLEWMDRHGIYSQILYPNVAGFGAGYYLGLKEPELMLECARAYNDFLVDFCSLAPGRFIPVMALPFWDLDATLQEMRRCTQRGHKGLVFTSQPEAFGQPDIWDRYWDPLWALAQDLELAVNFHVSSGQTPAEVSLHFGKASPGERHAHYGSWGVVFFMGNARALSKVIFSGVCHRFPRLNFVSVESGIGWIPYALEAMDWQWKNGGVHIDHPEYDLLPTEYFKRQIYGCFWFEEGAAKAAIELLGPDNFLYETDFPHATSMSPGPASAAISPAAYIQSTLGQLPLETARKLLHDNAARLYHIS